jgi:pimeloyl-ACP methyl ester carboxylesterase
MRTFETSYGPVSLWGDSSRPNRPLVLAILGFLATSEQLGDLHQALPEFDVVRAVLPGTGTPHLREPSVQSFAGAFDDIVQQQFAGRRVIRVGISIGGLVTLAMRRGAAFVAVDPPLNTGALWPLATTLRDVLATADGPKPRAWLANVFGYGADGWENRDYRPLLNDLAGTGYVLIAGEQLEPEREISSPPGLMTAEDRALVQRHPLLRWAIVGGVGHNIVRDAPHVLLEAIRRAERLSRQDGPG